MNAKYHTYTQNCNVNQIWFVKTERNAKVGTILWKSAIFCESEQKNTHTLIHFSKSKQTLGKVNLQTLQWLIVRENGEPNPVPHTHFETRLKHISSKEKTLGKISTFPVSEFKRAEKKRIL